MENRHNLNLNSQWHLSYVSYLVAAFSNTDEPYADLILSMSETTDSRKWTQHRTRVFYKLFFLINSVCVLQSLKEDFTFYQSIWQVDTKFQITTMRYHYAEWIHLQERQPFKHLSSSLVDRDLLWKGRIFSFVANSFFLPQTPVPMRVGIEKENISLLESQKKLTEVLPSVPILLQWFRKLKWNGRA